MYTSFILILFTVSLCFSSEPPVKRAKVAAGVETADQEFPAGPDHGHLAPMIVNTLEYEGLDEKQPEKRSRVLEEEELFGGISFELEEMQAVLPEKWLVAPLLERNQRIWQLVESAKKSITHWPTRRGGAVILFDELVKSICQSHLEPLYECLVEDELGRRWSEDYTLGEYIAYELATVFKQFILDSDQVYPLLERYLALGMPLVPIVGEACCERLTRGRGLWPVDAIVALFARLARDGGPTTNLSANCFAELARGIEWLQSQSHFLEDLLRVIEAAVPLADTDDEGTVFMLLVMVDVLLNRSPKCPLIVSISNLLPAEKLFVQDGTTEVPLIIRAIVRKHIPLINALVKKKAHRVAGNVVSPMLYAIQLGDYRIVNALPKDPEVVSIKQLNIPFPRDHFDVRFVKAIIDKGLHDLKDSDGNTLLHLLMWAPKKQLGEAITQINRLLKQNVSLYSRNKKGWMPLHILANRRLQWHDEPTKKLVRRMLDIFTEGGTTSPDTPVLDAEGHVVGPTPLMLAAFRNGSTVEQLLEYGADPLRSSKIKDVNRKIIKSFPLSAVTRNGNLTVEQVATFIPYIIRNSSFYPEVVKQVVTALACLRRVFPECPHNVRPYLIPQSHLRVLFTEALWRGKVLHNVDATLVVHVVSALTATEYKKIKSIDCSQLNHRDEIQEVLQPEAIEEKMKTLVRL